jgi:hypothetical protein
VLRVQHSLRGLALLGNVGSASSGIESGNGRPSCLAYAGREPAALPRAETATQFRKTRPADRYARATRELDFCASAFGASHGVHVREVDDV